MTFTLACYRIFRIGVKVRWKWNKMNSWLATMWLLFYLLHFVALHPILESVWFLLQSFSAKQSPECVYFSLPVCLGRFGTVQFSFLFFFRNIWLYTYASTSIYVTLDSHFFSKMFPTLTDHSWRVNKSQLHIRKIILYCNKCEAVKM